MQTGTSFPEHRGVQLQPLPSDLQDPVTPGRAGCGGGSWRWRCKHNSNTKSTRLRLYFSCHGEHLQDLGSHGIPWVHPDLMVDYHGNQVFPFDNCHKNMGNPMEAPFFWCSNPPSLPRNPPLLWQIQDMSYIPLNNPVWFWSIYHGSISPIHPVQQH